MPKHYQKLFEKFTNRDISPEELEQLLSWIGQNDDFKDIEVLERIWASLETSKSIDKRKARRIQSKLEARMNREGEGGKGSSKVKRLSPPLPRVTRVAASLFLAIIAGLGVVYFLNSPVVVESDFGEIVEVTLPDNSKVRLNANSQISYPRLWYAQEVRTVSLDGEAFFEVSKDMEGHKKFVVKTKDMSVEVLGTEFNVNTRDISTRVFLKAGSVKLNSLDRSDSLLMVPGEEAGLDDHGSLAKTKLADALPPVDWKDGSMVLKDKPLSEILREYKNVFGDKFEVADKELLNQSFTVMFPITDKEKALNILQDLTGDPIEVE